MPESQAADGQKTAANPEQTTATAPRPAPANIGEAKLEIMRRVPYLLKRKPGKEERGIKYTYAAEPDIIALVRPVMIEFAVDLRPAKVEVVLQEAYQSKQGGSMNRLRIKQTFIFRHVPSGTEDTCEIIGEGADPGDKGSGKAHTGAYKYAIREYFCIETGDDPDRVSSETQERKAKPTGFDVACRTVRAAHSVSYLNRLRTAYCQRDYTAEEVEQLERLYWQRAKELGAKIPKEYQAQSGPPDEEEGGYHEDSGA